MKSGLIQEGRRLRELAGPRTLALACLLVLGLATVDRAGAIDVKLTMEEAKEALAAGRDPMLAAYSAKTEDEQRKKIATVLSKATERFVAVADQEKDPCTRVMFGTKRFTLEEYGRTEAKESIRKKKDVRMPERFIQKVITMPFMQIDVHVCGDDEYFAEGAEVVFQQGSKNIRPIDIGRAERGRKNEGPGPAYRSRFKARFSYESFDPTAKSKVVMFFPDGKLIEVPADFSKIR